MTNATTTAEVIQYLFGLALIILLPWYIAIRVVCRKTQEGRKP